MVVVEPTLEFERSLHRAGHRYVIGIDEVGRGAIAGPVAVGIAVVERLMRSGPPGLRDSKLLAEKRREQIAPLAARWARHSAVGLASAEEVDELGIMACLRLAATRALATVEPDMLAESVLVLDGNHDYVRAHRVVTRVKADQTCASVAAASVIAKVHRDRMMIAADAEIPGYGWTANKGYASSAHYDAIRELGPSSLHRHTWLHKLGQQEFEFGEHVA
jgi:ribonuclease HII